MNENERIIWTNKLGLSDDIKSLKTYIIKDENHLSGYPVGTMMIEVEFKNEIWIKLFGDKT